MVLILCECSKQFTDFEKFNEHIKCHIEKLDLYYKCLETSCSRRYHSLKSFQQHLRHHHNNKLDETYASDGGEEFGENEPLIAKPSSFEFAKDDTFSPNSSQDIANKEEADEYLEWFAMYHAATNVENDEKVNVNVTRDNFADTIFKYNCQFLSAIYNRPDIPRNVVQHITEECTKLLNNEAVEFLRDEIIIQLSNAGASQEVVNNIRTMFKTFQHSFAKLSTEWKRLQAFIETGTFTFPTSIKIGIDKGVKRVKRERTDTDEDVFAQCIPISERLKQILSLPTVCDRIQIYVKLLSEHPNQISNFMQGELWKKISLCYDSKKVFPLFLNFDDWEGNNITGSHAGGGGKIGATYVIFPFLPPEFHGKLENIFLTLIFNSNDRKIYGNRAVFKQLFKELKVLAEDGILIQTVNGYERLYFVLALILGDNLDLNGIHGYVESLTKTNFCRICNIDHATAGTACSIPKELLRTEESYETALKQFKETGKITMRIKDQCVWNYIPHYHVTQNVNLDFLHDCPEGALKVVLLAVLNHFDKENIIQVLNDRLPAFNFGFNAARNTPPILDPCLVKQYKFRPSASETLTLMRHLGMLVGDLIPEGDEHWELYISLNEIINIILTKTHHPSCSQLLQTLVEEHLNLFRRVVKKKLTPKQHFLLHYSLVMNLVGPMCFTSSIRGEGKHKEYKTNARASVCRKNLPYTLALKNQLRIHEKLSSRKVTSNVPSFGPIYSVHIEDLIDHNKFATKLPCSITERVQSCKWIEHMSDMYELGAVLMKIESTETRFLIIPGKNIWS